MTPADTSCVKSDDQMNQVMAAITNLTPGLNTAQTITKLLPTQTSVFEGQKISAMKWNIFFYTTCDHSGISFQMREKVFFLSPFRDDIIKNWYAN